MKSKKTTIKDVVSKAKEELQELTGFKFSSAAGAKKEGQGWIVLIEMVEKKGIPDRMDILGIYEVKTDAKGKLLSYERKGLRKRGDVTVEEVESEE